MKTLFGLRSNIALTIVGILYLIISLRTSIYGLEYLQNFHLDEDAVSRSTTSQYLLINTDTKLFHIISTILSVSCLLSSVLLILGAIEKRHVVIRPWLLLNIVFEAILVSFFLYLIFTLIEIQVYCSDWNSVCGILLAIFITAIAVAFHDYVRNGAYSLYIKMEKESRRLYRVIDNTDNQGVQTV